MTYLNLQAYFFIALLVGIGLLTAQLLRPYFSALVLAAMVAVIFYPLYQRLLTIVGNRPAPAALATTGLVLVILFVPVTFFGFQIFQEARLLYLTVSASQVGLPGWLSGVTETQLHRLLPGVSINIPEYTRQALSWLLQNAGGAFTSLAQLVVNSFITLLALYYFLKDGRRLRRSIVSFSPLRDRYDDQIATRLHIAVMSVVKGSLSIALLQGFVTGVGLKIFGIPSPALWGSLAIVAALIPTFGTSIVIVPAAVYLFLTDQLSMSVGLIIWGLVAVGLIDNLLGPKLIERGLRIHPFLILLTVLGGITMFGPLGFFVGPLCLSLFFALLDIYPSLLPAPTAASPLPPVRPDAQ